MLPFFPFHTEYAVVFLPKNKKPCDPKSQITRWQKSNKICTDACTSTLSPVCAARPYLPTGFQSMTFRAVPAIGKSQRSSAGKQQIALSGINHESTSSSGSCCDSNTGTNQCQSPKCKFIYFYSKPIRRDTLPERFFMNVACLLLSRRKKNFSLRQIPLARSPFPGYSLNRLFGEED